MELTGFIASALAGLLIGWALELVPFRWRDQTEWILGASLVLFAIIAPRGAEDGFGPLITLVMLFGVAVFAFTRWFFNRRRSESPQV